MILERYRDLRKQYKTFLEQCDSFQRVFELDFRTDIEQMRADKIESHNRQQRETREKHEKQMQEQMQLRMAQMQEQMDHMKDIKEDLQKKRDKGTQHTQVSTETPQEPPQEQEPSQPQPPPQQQDTRQAQAQQTTETRTDAQQTAETQTAQNSTGRDAQQETPVADIVDVRKLYRALSKRCHPDNGGDADTYAAIQKAYENRQVDQLLETALDLGLDLLKYGTSERIEQFLQTEIERIETAMNQIKQSLVWQWCICPDSEKHRIRDKILRQLREGI